MRFSIVPLAAVFLPVLLAHCAPLGAAARPAPVPRAGVIVTLYREIDICSAQVTLGDVADIAGDDARLIARLRVLALGGSPAGQAVLKRAALARWVRAQTGLDARDLAWAGADEVQLHRRVQDVIGAELEPVAYDELVETLAPFKGRLDIHPLANRAKVELPAGRLQFRARALPAGVVPTRHMLVWVDVMVDGRFVRAVPVRFEVSVFVPGWAVKAPAMAGSLIPAEAVAPREVDLATADIGEEPARRQDDTFRSPGELVLLRQDLRPGQILTWKNAVPAPLVARGASALLRLHGEGIALESRVQVLQDGFFGQTVKVRAPGATGTVLATVAGPGMLEAQQ
jgi:flagella basal body P-ring formation protein FlgA